MTRSSATLHNIDASATNVSALAENKGNKPHLTRRTLPPQRVRFLVPPPRRAAIYRRDGVRGDRVRALAAPPPMPMLWRRGPSQTRLYNLMATGTLTMSNKTLSAPSITGTTSSSGAIHAQGLSCNQSSSQTLPGGLYLVGQGNQSYIIYAGTTKSASGLTITGYGDVTTGQWSTRFRHANTTGNGFVFESNTQSLMALGSATGNRRLRGTFLSEGAVLSVVSGCRVPRVQHAATGPNTRIPTRYLKSLDARAAVLESGKLVSDLIYSSNTLGGAALVVTPSTNALTGAALTLQTWGTLQGDNVPTCTLQMDMAGVQCSPSLSTPALVLGGVDLGEWAAGVDSHLSSLDAAASVSGVVDGLQSLWDMGLGAALMPKLTSATGLAVDALKNWVTPRELCQYVDADAVALCVGEEFLSLQPAGVFETVGAQMVERASNMMDFNGLFRSRYMRVVPDGIVPAAAPALEVGAEDASVFTVYDDGSVVASGDVCATRVQGVRYLRQHAQMPPRLTRVATLAVATPRRHVPLPVQRLPPTRKMYGDAMRRGGRRRPSMPLTRVRALAQLARTANRRRGALPMVRAAPARRMFARSMRRRTPLLVPRQVRASSTTAATAAAAPVLTRPRIAAVTLNRALRNTRTRPLPHANLNRALSRVRTRVAALEAGTQSSSITMAASTSIDFSQTTGAVGTAAGSRVRLWPNATAPSSSDYAIGIASGTIWYNAGAGGVHKFYTAGTRTLMVGATGVVTTPSLVSEDTIACPTTLLMGSDSTQGNGIGISWYGATPSASFATYFAQSGNARSFTGGTAVAGGASGGITSWAIRNRIGSTNNCGFLVETDSATGDVCLFSVGNTGYCYVKAGAECGDHV